MIKAWLGSQKTIKLLNHIFINLHNMQSFRRFLPALALFIVAVLIRILLPELNNVPAHITNSVGVIGTIVLIAAFTSLLIAIIRAAKNNLLKRFDLSVADNLRMRKLHTQYNILEKVVVFIIIVIALAIMLMQFENVRNIGISIFASAGIAGLILGLAAQKALGTILAGLQIAITQPIRLDDVVIVEKEWGWIEEINLTYVVVRIWDKRRLIVPSTYFLDNAFQNWTRTSADILGTVFIYTDYTIPINAVREKLTSILEASRWWDKKVNVLQVTDARENTLELRALMSAASSPDAWELRVYVREQLVSFIQEHYPDSLPKTRVKFESSNNSA